MNTLFKDTEFAENRFAPLSIGWSLRLPLTFERNFELLMGSLKYDYGRKTVYPVKERIFAAFDDMPPKNVRVVVVGQDPYFSPKGQATGRAFACGLRESPSITKMFETFSREEHQHENRHMNLKYLAEQNVLLLNAALTTVAGRPGSHTEIWKEFTKQIIKVICEANKFTIWMLWGKDAKSYMDYLTTVNINKHPVLTADHPAYAARKGGLWECDNFTDANKLLINKEYKPIYW